MDGTFQTQVVIEEFDGFGRQGQHADLVSFAADPDLRLGQLEILTIERQYFAGSQAMQQHQTDDGQVA